MYPLLVLHSSFLILLWPTPILFDAIYAGTVLHHFGTPILKDEVVTTWKDTFYPDGVITTAHVDYKVITDEKARRGHRTKPRIVRRAMKLAGPDTFDMLMTLLYIMVPRNKLLYLLDAVIANLRWPTRRQILG